MLVVTDSMSRCTCCSAFTSLRRSLWSALEGLWCPELDALTHCKLERRLPPPA